MWFCLWYQPHGLYIYFPGSASLLTLISNIRNSCYTLSICPGPRHCPPLSSILALTSSILKYCIPLLLLKLTCLLSRFIGLFEELWTILVGPFTDPLHHTTCSSEPITGSMDFYSDRLTKNANMPPEKITCPLNKRLLSLLSMWSSVQGMNTKPKLQFLTYLESRHLHKHSKCCVLVRFAFWCMPQPCPVICPL